MDEIKVSKQELIQVITINRDAHHQIWENAYENYHKACIKALEHNLEAFKSKKANRVFINESPPEDHTKDYDRVIRMLNMSLDDTVMLSEQEFQQYVLDDWQWKQVWTTSNSKYM